MQYLFFLYRCATQQFRDVKQLSLEFCYQLLPGICLGMSVANMEMFLPPLPQNFVSECPEVVRDQCETQMVDGDVPTTIFFIVMVVGAAANISAVRSFGESNEKANYYREASSGMNTYAYFLAKCTYDLWNIFRLCYIFLMLYLLLTDPPGSKIIWALIMYSLYFASYGIGYFFSNIMDHDDALVSAVIAAVAFSVTSGLSPKLTDVNSYPPLPFIWWISSSRWAAEAVYINMVASWPWLKDRLDTNIEDSGYKPDNLALDIGLTFFLGVVWRVAAYVALRLRNRNKQK